MVIQKNVSLGAILHLDRACVLEAPTLESNTVTLQCLTDYPLINAKLKLKWVDGNGQSVV